MPGSVSLKAIIIGIAAAIAATLIVSLTELVAHNICIGGLQLPPVSVALLVVVVAAGAAAGRVRARFALAPQEVLTIYCMTLFAAMVSSHGLLERVIPLLVGPAYHANESNGWAAHYFPHIKQWLVPFDPNPDQSTPPLVAKRFFEGLRGGEHIPWSLWIKPLLAWGLFALLIFGAFLCLASILRRQWVDNERLSFPLAELPLQTAGTRDQTSIFRKPAFYFGFALPAFVFSIHGIHHLYPDLPHITTYYRIDTLFPDAPWNAMRYTALYVSFAAIGFFFLLPTEIIFSLWFFWALMKLQLVGAAAYGFDAPPMGIYPVPAFIGYQAMGAYFVLAIVMLLLARPHLKAVGRAVMGRGDVDDSNELLPYRAAVIGLFVCLLGAAAWLTVAGMSAWLAVAMLLVFVFVIALVTARSTAEAGILLAGSSFRPLDVYRLFAPASSLGASNLTVLAFVDTAFFVELRGLLLTGFLDSMRIADRARIRLRSFLPVFALAILIAMVIGAIVQIVIPYDVGGMQMHWRTYSAAGCYAFQNYDAAMLGPVQGVGWQGPGFLLVGAAVTAFLSVMRYAVFWWPLHPLGYALCGSEAMTAFWFPCFAAWALKSIAVRYGGMRIYKQAMPFCIGMVVGEFTTAVVWALISWHGGIIPPEFPWP